MKSRNKKRLLALVLCMVVAISNSSFIFASETGQTEYPQEVQTQDEAVADDMDVAAYAADEGQAVADEQPAAVEQVAAEPAAEPETTAVAPAEQPAAEAPAAEQPTTEAPAAETPAAQEPAAAPTEETASAAENATAETPEEDETQAEAENQQLTWSQDVGDTTVNVTAEAGALPADAQLSVTEITSEDEVKEIEKAVEEKAIEEQFSIKNIFSYDIKFLVNGSEVQPTTPVQVSVDTPEITSSEDAAVLHVDNNNVAEDMKGTVDGEGKVVFDAPHFSKYVIVQKGDSKVTVTIQHYENNETEKTKIYADDVRELPVGGVINDYTKATNWTVAKVVQVEKGSDGVEKETEIDTKNDFEVTKDCTIRVYYDPKSKKVDGSTTLYDYTVKAGSVTTGSYMWQTTTNYSFNSLGDSANGNQKITAGAISQNYSGYQYDFSVGNKKVNDWTGTNGGVITGLLNGIDSDDNVKFKYPEPGFFVNSDAKATVDGEKRDLRKVYKDYKLTFQQNGDTYELESVKDGNGAVQTTAGADFFPLDSVLPSYEGGFTKKTQSSLPDDGKTHNYYFGMRYDVTFKIGDYVGPLNYTFTGDDDLWVVLTRKDNNKQDIVIDLGGIHDAETADVDLWEYIGDPAKLTEEDKQAEYKLTVLYMERGAGASNCSMKFTLPEARISEVSSVPMADLVIQKVNSKGEKLSGAEFSLTNKATGEKLTAKSVGTDGLAQFTKLRVGEYELKENAAPNDYIPSLDTWIVKVTESNGSATATLYLADGTTEYTQKSGSYYQILNVTKEELINSSLTYNKTAKVLDWDERTYQINITASSKVQNSTTVQEKKTGDAMLVFDLSGSMNGDMSGRGTPDAKEVGEYKEKKNQLDTTKIYYYGNKTGAASGTTDSYETYYKNPMIYVENFWQYWDGSKWNRILDNDKKTIYTWESRINALKEAAIGFVVSTASSSPDSKIGISIFKGKYGEELVNKLERVGSQPTEMIKNIAKMTAAAGTYPAKGLDIAKDQLKKSSGTNSKYVILFSDGDPSSGAKTPAETSIEELKTEGYYIYTVGLGVTETTKEWLKGLASNSEYALTATNANELKTIFQTIQQNINHPVEIKNAEIIDVIDNKFVILDKSNQPITKDTVGIKDGISVGDGKVYYDETNDRFFIKWTDQTISHSSKGADGVVTPGWSRTITVKAKDDYIGGNNVATNISPDSKISTGYGEAVLPQPTVNVKAELTIKDKEITIYKGDTLPNIDSILEEMFNLTANANRYNINKNAFTMTWYDTNNNRIDSNAISSTENGTYHLKVTYNAGKPTPKSTTNTDGNIAGGDDWIVEAINENDNTQAYGIYTINVISGKIKLTKKLETELTEDKEFVFDVKVTKDGKETIIKVPVTVKEGQKEAIYEGELLTDLARGTYTITEEVPDGYVLTDYAIASDDKDTNCENSDDSEKESVTFKLGYEKNKENVNVIKDYTYNESNGGTIGTVAFTNEKATTNWDIVKVSTSGTGVHLEGAEFILLDKNNKTAYTGTSDANGKIIWKKGNGEVENLEKGTYTLVEKKAPLGYVLSTEQWKITVTKNGSLVAVTTDKTGQEIEKSTISVADATLHLYFKNAVVYDLPSTGHTGIFNILMSGILLMFAGILIIYKMKGKEVLKK